MTYSITLDPSDLQGIRQSMMEAYKNGFFHGKEHSEGGGRCDEFHERLVKQVEGYVQHIAEEAFQMGMKVNRMQEP